tara:strand:- start:385 stop:777 length:393 start_codon:yes stop_codon:yes gene_type:complete
MVPPLMVDLVCHWVSQPTAHELLAWQTQELAARQQIVTDYLAGYSLSRQPNGSNVWLTLPDGVRALELCERLSQQGVKVTNAEPFCVGSAPAPQAVRICIGAAADQTALKRALAILRASLEQPPLATATV